MCALVAQWLEHWSSKPGVESSILSEGRWTFLATSVDKMTASVTNGTSTAKTVRW